MKSAFKLSNRELFDKAITNRVKGICMLLIILGHCWIKVKEAGGITYADTFFSFIGTWGAGVFIFLSGYGMYISMNSNFIDYLYIKKKVTKLFIPFFRMWLFAIVLLYLFPSLSCQYSFKDLVISFFTIGMPIDKSNWFFRIIVLLYLLSFIIFRVFHKQDNLVKIFLIFMVCVSYMMICRHYKVMSYWWETILYYPLGLACGFFRKAIQSLFSELIIKFKFIYLIPFLSAIIGVLYIKFFNKFLPCGWGSIILCVFLISVYHIVSPRFKYLVFVGESSLYFYFFQEIPLSYFPLFTSDQIIFSIYTIICTTFLSILLKNKRKNNYIKS